MRSIRIFFLLFFIGIVSNAQESIDDVLSKFNKESVPYVSVAELLREEGVLLLDTRKKEEYDVSHLENAIWVGYKGFILDSVLHKVPAKEVAIVVYCSIGVRSENIGEKLVKAGYTDVKNLYGGIFEWKNKGYPVFNLQGEPTNAVHAFNRRWGKLLINGEKIYDEKVKTNLLTAHKDLLLIFTRNPELGKCKTRLATTVGEEAALKIYKFLLQHTVNITENLKTAKEGLLFRNHLGRRYLAE